MILTTDREREAFEAGRRQGNAEMTDVAIAAWETAPAAFATPSLMPERGSITLAELARRIALEDPDRLAILRPYDRREVLPLKTAASLSGRSESTLREWSTRYGIGRSIVGAHEISQAALFMLLDGNGFALAALLSGRRDHPSVAPYLARCGIEIAA